LGVAWDIPQGSAIQTQTHDCPVARLVNCICEIRGAARRIAVRASKSRSAEPLATG
jgi:hypothetical protein